MLKTPQVVKESIYAQVRSKFNGWYGDRQPVGGDCMRWTQCGLVVLSQSGFEPLLQAGTMMWRMVPPEKDDGVAPTHFSYVWEPESPASIEAVCNGNMPEMHMWIAIPSTREIVDFSTGSFARLARERHKLNWLSPDPPDYAWGEIPEDVHYIPVAGAVGYALSLFRKI